MNDESTRIKKICRQKHGPAELADKEKLEVGHVSDVTDAAWGSLVSFARKKPLVRDNLGSNRMVPGKKPSQTTTKDELQELE